MDEEFDLEKLKEALARFGGATAPGIGGRKSPDLSGMEPLNTALEPSDTGQDPTIPGERPAPGQAILDFLSQIEGGVGKANEGIRSTLYGPAKGPSFIDFVLANQKEQPNRGMGIFSNMGRMGAQGRLGMGKYQQDEAASKAKTELLGAQTGATKALAGEREARTSNILSRTTGQDIKNKIAAAQTQTDIDKAKEELDLMRAKIEETRARAGQARGSEAWSRARAEGLPELNERNRILAEAEKTYKEAMSLARKKEVEIRKSQVDIYRSSVSSQNKARDLLAPAQAKRYEAGAEADRALAGQRTKGSPGQEALNAYRKFLMSRYMHSIGKMGDKAFMQTMAALAPVLGDLEFDMVEGLGMFGTGSELQPSTGITAILEDPTKPGVEGTFKGTEEELEEYLKQNPHIRRKE